MAQRIEIIEDGTMRITDKKGNEVDVLFSTIIFAAQHIQEQYMIKDSNKVKP